MQSLYAAASFMAQSKKHNVPLEIPNNSKLPQYLLSISAAIFGICLLQNITYNKTNGDKISENENMTCVICHENQIKMVAVPCYHAMFCIGCTSKLSNTCPICKATVNYKKIYF